MSDTPAPGWIEDNQRHLAASLSRLRGILERRSIDKKPEIDSGEAAQEAQDLRDGTGAAANSLPVPSQLEFLCQGFGLSGFERDILLLCAGIELDSTFQSLCATAQGNPNRPYPTFSLALAALPDAHWSALSPSSPLRYWRMIEVVPGDALTTSPLRIDERILHFLVGVHHIDERLAGILEPLRDEGDLVQSHRSTAEGVAAAWSMAAGRSALPVVQLCGGDIAAKRSIALSACRILGLNLNIVGTRYLPAAANEINALVRLCEREGALSKSALLLDCDDIDAAETGYERQIHQMVESLRGPLIISSRARRRDLHRSTIAFDVSKPALAEQRASWEAFMGSVGGLNGQVDALVSQFDLSAQEIRGICAEVAMAYRPPVGLERPGRASPDESEVASALWTACRRRAGASLDDMAQRIETRARRDDLVLPGPQKELLHDIAVHVKQRHKVYQGWGFAQRSSRGLGISALFAGSSGTGKTMAAEVLANELHLDLYRIDLSSVVSKYIGETEKNLRRVFDAAEAGGSILLFDEADALFGRRSEVKDSHDRYANVEVSYLLQRMESYRGLAILTTNLKSAIDSAFLRRIRFVVQFPFPDERQRAEIWRRIFPEATPTEGLDVKKLARLNVAGGSIRNIALNAAFTAADAGEPVRMGHLMKAARAEYAKMEKSLTEAEAGGWV
jgi:hypothetical protein